MIDFIRIWACVVVLMGLVIILSSISDVKNYFWNKKGTRMERIPAPLRVPLNNGDKYYIVDFINPLGFSKCTWESLPGDFRFLELGIAHVNTENAKKHSEMLLLITKSTGNT